MNTADLIDNITQEVAALHAVIHSAKDSGNHVTAVVAIRAGQLTQVRKQPGALAAIGPDAFFVVNECEKFVTCDAIHSCGPIAPAVWRLNGWAELFSCQLRFFLALEFEVIEELEKHYPRQHRQAVKVTVQAFVLAHNVTRGFQQAAEGLRGGM